VRAFFVVAVGCIGCDEIVDLGPEREHAADAPEASTWDGATRQIDTSSGLLLLADAEGVEGACRDELPPFTLPESGEYGDCNHAEAPIAGRESIHFDADDWVGCDRCWPGSETEIWFSALARVHANNYFALAVADFTVVDDAIKEWPAGPIVDWAGAEVWMTCPADEPDAGKSLLASVAAEPGQPYSIVLHFSTDRGDAEFWVRPYDGSAAPVIPDGPPDGALACKPSSAVVGYKAYAMAKSFEKGGAGYLDNVAIARSAAALRGVNWE
jgi:hypothetical protein